GQPVYGASPYDMSAPPTGMMAASNLPQSVDPSYSPHNMAGAGINAGSAAVQRPGSNAATINAASQAAVERGGQQPWPARNWRDQVAARDQSLAQMPAAGQPVIQPAGAMLPAPGYGSPRTNGAAGSSAAGAGASSPGGFISQADHLSEAS